MLLSINYQIAIAKWDNGKPEGETIIFYPNGSIFYGTIQNNKLVGTNIFQTSNNKNIYLFLKSDQQGMVILDSPNSKTLVAAKLSSFELGKLL